MAKGAQAKAAKAVNEREKGERSAAAAEAAEAAKWDDPGSKKGNKKADQQAEAARKRDEKARLQAEEDAATNSIKSKASGPKKGKDSAPKNVRSFKVPEPEISSVNASGIDNVLDAVDVVNAKNDKASLGSKAAKDIETHPERRFKGAFEAYVEREMPVIKEEHKGLRLNQYKDILYKQFQKSPENPFNQTTAAYNATKEDKVELVQKNRKEIEKRLGDVSLS